MWGTCHAAARHTLALGTEVTVQSRRPAQSPLGPGSRVAASGSRRPLPGDAGASAPSRSAVPGPVPALRRPSPPPCAVAHGEQRATSVTQRAREGVRKRDVWVWGHQRHVCEASRGGDGTGSACARRVWACDTHAQSLHSLQNPNRQELRPANVPGTGLRGPFRLSAQTTLPGPYGPPCAGDSRADGHTQRRAPR